MFHDNWKLEYYNKRVRVKLNYIADAQQQCRNNSLITI